VERVASKVNLKIILAEIIGKNNKSIETLYIANCSIGGHLHVLTALLEYLDLPIG